MTLRLSLDKPDKSYAPGELISGTIRWDKQVAPKWVEIRLYWYTSGYGTQDIGISTTERFTNLRERDERSLLFTAPSHPISCRGQLVSITWAIEALCENERNLPSIDIVIGPFGREIELNQEEHDPN